MKIPPRLFQTYVHETPFMASWRRLNPAWDYAFFDDAACRRFVQQHMEPAVYETYTRLLPGAARADLWRYCVLYTHGGVYVDADCSCLVPLRDWIGAEAELVVPVDHEHQPALPLFQAVLGCTPGHPLMRAAIDAVVRHVQTRQYRHRIFELSGPTCLGRCLNAVHGRAPEAPWGAAQATPQRQLLTHRRFRDDSVWQGGRKVVQSQERMTRTGPSHRRQTFYYR
jgi:mannosyltransferase OCH1-like enzyme